MLRDRLVATNPIQPPPQQPSPCLDKTSRPTRATWQNSSIDWANFIGNHSALPASPTYSPVVDHWAGLVSSARRYYPSAPCSCSKGILRRHLRLLLCLLNLKRKATSRNSRRQTAPTTRSSIQFDCHLLVPYQPRLGRRSKTASKLTGHSSPKGQRGAPFIFTSSPVARHHSQVLLSQSLPDQPPSRSLNLDIFPLVSGTATARTVINPAPAVCCCTNRPTAKRL